MNGKPATSLKLEKTGLPTTYRAAQIEEKGVKFKLVQKPIKMPQGGEVLVKVLACGMCHTDAGYVAEGLVPLPRVPGHEIVGEVAAIGAGETRWKVGDRVGSGWVGGHCGVCESCDEGDFVLCEKSEINGVLKDGGYAEYVMLKGHALSAVPNCMDPAEAAGYFCAGVTTFTSLKNSDARPGDLVAIQGIGGLGHLAIQYANKMGFRVVAISSSNAKRKTAMELGAHYYLDGSKCDPAAELAKMGGAKIIMCNAPSGEAINKLFGGIARNGTILVLSMAEGIKFDSVQFILKRGSIKTWPVGTAKECGDTVKFSADQGVRCLVERYKLDDVDAAFQRMLSGDASYRVVLVP